MFTKIAAACAVECERQQTDLEEVGFLIAAYAAIWQDDDAFREVESFQKIGAIVEPYKNRFGFRTTPVTFQDGGSSASAVQIPRMMELLVEMIGSMWQGNEDISIDDCVKEFLWIHPFRDGNGRVGFLLQNYLDGTLDDPHPLRKHF